MTQSADWRYDCARTGPPRRRVAPQLERSPHAQRTAHICTSDTLLGRENHNINPQHSRSTPEATVHRPPTTVLIRHTQHT